jgi:hypothetical protein
MFPVPMTPIFMRFAPRTAPFGCNLRREGRTFHDGLAEDVGRSSDSHGRPIPDALSEVLQGLMRAMVASP